eukprot:257680-Pelagomonas_calceolata.AAC.3
MRQFARAVKHATGCHLASFHQRGESSVHLTSALFQACQTSHPLAAAQHPANATAHNSPPSVQCRTCRPVGLSSPPCPWLTMLPLCCVPASGGCVCALVRLSQRLPVPSLVSVGGPCRGNVESQ